MLDPQPQTITELSSMVGAEVGVSPWIEIDQAMVDRFADATRDHQFIHVDPAAAARTSFGGTIAHGFLTLSLLSHLAHGALRPVAGRAMGINYGFDRVRFITPVRTGARVRGRFRLVEVAPRDAQMWLIRYGVTVEIEGTDKAALVADWLTLAVMSDGRTA